MKARNALACRDKPAKVHHKDVHFIKSETHQKGFCSLLTQSEYDAVKKYMHDFKPKGLKLSRKKNTLDVSKSILFDETGKAYSLYRGKSWNQLLQTAGVPKEQGGYRADASEIKSLGKGAFGRVKLCQELETGQWYAAKIIPTSPRQDARQSRAQVELESAGLKRMRRLQGQLYREDRTQKGYLLQALVHGDALHEWVLKEGAQYSYHHSPNACRLEVALKATVAVMQCHQKDLLHRDIKLDNFIVSPQSDEVTLIDFGMARQVGSGHIVWDRALVGTDGYLAPELTPHARGQYRYSTKTEVFALGQVVGALLFGKDFQSDFSKYSAESLRDFGLTEGDFLKPSAPREWTSLRGADLNIWTRQAPHHPERYPWVVFCRQLADKPSAKQLQSLEPSLQPWAILVGQMLAENPKNRPNLPRVEALLAKLLKVELTVEGHYKPTLLDKLLGRHLVPKPLKVASTAQASALELPVKFTAKPR